MALKLQLNEAIAHDNINQSVAIKAAKFAATFDVDKCFFKTNFFDNFVF